MDGRKTRLSKLVVGDIFQAHGPYGARPPCLIYAVTESLIKARAVTTQMHFEFDRETGMGKWFDGLPVSIGSIAPLPVDIHNIVLSMDRKSRLLRSTDDGRLTDDEKRALRFLADHHKSNPM